MRSPSRYRVALVLVVAALFVTPAAALSLPASTQTQSAPAQTATDDSIAPGAQLAGVVAVGQTELDGAIEGRAFGQAIAAAESDERKAAVVADRLPAIETRLEELRQQREQLRTAYENGTLDRDTYRARTAALAARTQQLEHQLNRSRSVADALPEQARAAAGLDVSEIDSLREQASEMRGGEVAEIARGIAGPSVGKGMPDSPGGPPAGVPGNWTGGPGSGPGGPADPGPPDDSGPHMGQ
ncbi:hypothetical protein [Halapricum hydrolyticum]|uniref:Uncharacterized protein n=1 Tax=Halapricum hydrolyticum TaxID=2979991 RepID=A0AAE3IAU0_9EURY|nr:hypothetical protein [Halapricum hydrolyticum]MCU4717970.1 hypothetical protein [Halapricum hydrolyticum]MCU4727135.1 hypothetical protein [Halapricum hydrolyticum]